jgi:hypothetical protein
LWELHELFDRDAASILAMEIDQHKILSLAASSSACLQGDERGCGKQIGLQLKPLGG